MNSEDKESLFKVIEEVIELDEVERNNLAGLLENNSFKYCVNNKVN